ncbi:MAG: hypothetical protein H6725_08515 [Sandaracinaceae bacterium]|nr:hypothetical protein [Sandaracinaceae bacterium]
MNPTLYTLAMVIAERGSDWESWVDQLRREADDVCLIVQQPGETVSELAARVRQRVDALQPYEALGKAVVVSGGRVDQDAVAARSLAIRAIVAPMVRAGHGNVVLASNAKDRFSMMGLASTVASMIRGTGVDIQPAAQLARVA